MKRDLLAESLRALEESADEAPVRPEETRARVMASLRRRSTRRVAFIRLALPIAAVLAGSIAWAAAAGKLPSPFRSAPPSDHAAPPGDVRSKPIFAGAPAPPALETARVELPEGPAPLAAAPEPPPSPQKESPPPDAPTDHAASPAPREGAASPGLKEGAAAPAPLPAPRPAPAAVTATPSALPAAAPPRDAPTPPEATSRAAPVETEEDTLYKAAHRLHFAQRDASAALTAWDAYLRAAPRGRLSVEARYNRALCLARLGRTAEARSALEGFARGAYGGYRKDEARALLEAMGSSSP